MSAADTTSNRDFLAELDAAIGCQQCGGPLGDSPSDDFCRELCQDIWHAARHRSRGTIALNLAQVTTAPPSGFLTPESVRAVAMRARPVGVTPDGEVIARRADGRVAMIDHVVVRRHVDHLDAAFRQMGRDAELPEGWIERFAGFQLADWQRDILRGQYERWEVAGRRYREQCTRVMAALAPVVEQMGRAAADAVSALQPLAEALAPPKPPVDPRERALWLRRNRNTGPSASARAPRTINPRRGR